MPTVSPLKSWLPIFSLRSIFSNNRHFSVVSAQIKWNLKKQLSRSNGISVFQRGTDLYKLMIHIITLAFEFNDANTQDKTEKNLGNKAMQINQ